MGNFFNGDAVTFSGADIEIAKRLEKSVRDRFPSDTRNDDAVFASVANIARPIAGKI